MRTLSSTLLAAQRSASRVPYVKVVARDRLAGAVRLNWERLYTGTVTATAHALTMPGDGSMVRVRIGAGADAGKLYRQRVASPGPLSDFDSWTYTDQYDCQAAAVASLGAEVCIFWVKGNRELVWVRSDDYGVTWSSPQTLGYVTYQTVSGMAAACKPNGDIGVAIANQQMLYVKRRVGGTWQSSAGWDKTTGELSSVAVVYDGDWNLLVTGQDASDNYKVWSLVYGDGGAVAAGSWSDLREFASAPAGGDYVYRAAFMAKPDVYRAFYLEEFTGSQAYSRPFWSQTAVGSAFLSSLWREPVPFDFTGDCGLAIAHHGDYGWLSAPDGIWRAGLTQQSLELTADVIAARCESHPARGSLTIEVLNDDGTYNAPGIGGLAVLSPGCEVGLSPGHVTAQGNEASDGPAGWLEACEHVSAGGKTSLVLHCTDGWGLLAGWRARHQFRWNKGSEQLSVQQLLEFVLARVGVGLVVRSQSSTVTGFYPDFTIHPGDTGVGIIARLLSFVPDVLCIEGSTAILVNPLASDASVYSYGQSHDIWRGRYASGALDVNQVRVEGLDASGAPVLADSFSWAQVDRFPERLQSVTDRNIGTVAHAQARGAAMLRKAEVSAMSGSIRVPVNCGQQLYDIIDVTDSRAGLAAAKRRVLGMVLSYHAAPAEYTHELLLGGV